MIVKSFRCFLLLELQIVFCGLLGVVCLGAAHSVSKREATDLQTCLDNFDIHKDKIIRTQDSRKMGAKYLNEYDVSSRNECLRMCCETDDCDVFVFEEKNPGSCYLFQCGTPDDFKCKFTRHSNFTSAVLAINRHLTELESQIKFTQQEHELSKLRDPQKANISAPLIPSTLSPHTQGHEGYNLDFVQQGPSPKRKPCSRFQFECHKSGDCIAIYNACDGIPQCSDGSDEAPELGCPVHVSTLPATKVLTATRMPVELKNDLKKPASALVDEKSIENFPKQPVQRYWSQPVVLGEDRPMNTVYNKMEQGPDIPMSHINYGREGEGMINYPQQLQAFQYPTPQNHQGGSQIFTHKGNGLVPQEEHYMPPQRPYSGIQGNMVSYNEQVPNEYAKFYYDNAPYRIFPQPGQPSNWAPQNKLHDKPEEIRRTGNDYYYEDSNKNRVGIPTGLTLLESVPHQAEYGKEVVPPMKPQMKQGVLNNGQVRVSTQPPPNSLQTPPSVIIKEVTRHEENPKSLRKVEHLTVEARMQVSNFVEPEREFHSYNASGAILSLTLGLIITSIMVLVVGCRMRVVRRRMRRGGKSPYAHDADFLVNGMYL